MLTSLGDSRSSATPEQMFIMLGSLVAGAREASANSPVITADPAGQVGHEPDLSTTTTTTTTSRLLSEHTQGQNYKHHHHPDNNVNANSLSLAIRGALGGELPSVFQQQQQQQQQPVQPLNLTASQQLVRNLLLQVDKTGNQSSQLFEGANYHNDNKTTNYLAEDNNLGQYGNNYTQTSAQVGGAGAAAGAAAAAGVTFTSLEWLMIVTLITIIFISIVGNLLVCVAIFTDRRLRKLGNAFIVSLAIADLFVSFLVMTFALHNDLMDEWIFGAWFCDIWISFDIMCCTASILNLCAISLDRFIHIKDCLLYNQLMTRRVAISAVIMIWIISALVSFMPITLGLHKPSSANFILPAADYDQQRTHLASGLSNLERTTTKLPEVVAADQSLTDGGGVGVDDYRRRAGPERAKRAAHSRASLDLAPIKQEQIGHKLNYVSLAASGRVTDLANEPPPPIGTADTSEGPGRPSSRRPGNTTQVAAAAVLAAHQRDQSGREKEKEDEDKHTNADILMHATDEVRQFDQSAALAASRVASRAQDAIERDYRRTKSNLAEAKPRAPMEQIKHLARSKRQVPNDGGSLTSKLTTRDYGEQEDDELSSNEREQTNRRAHSPQRQPFDSTSSSRDTDNGRTSEPQQRANERQPPAQCVLTLTPTYAVISSTISFYIPCIIMLGLYSKLFACARRHVRNIKAISKVPQPIAGGGCPNQALGSNNNNNNNNNYDNYMATRGADNNNISSGRTNSTASNLTTGSRPADPLTPIVNRARHLIGNPQVRINQRKTEPDSGNCVIETTCGSSTINTVACKQSPHPASCGGAGNLARLVGARARTWIKLRAGETPRRHNSMARTCDTTDAADIKTDRQVASVTESSLAAGACEPPTRGRLVFKSILSSNQKQEQQQQEQNQLHLDRSTNQHQAGAQEDNTVTQSSTASANAMAELEPFLASARRAADAEGKSVSSTNALGVKLANNMTRAASNDPQPIAGIDGAGLACNSLHLGEHNQAKQGRQLHARIQQQQPSHQPTKQQTSQLATHKAAITLGIIMGTFLMCWFPFFCLNIIKAFYADLIPARIFRAFTWLGYANSALNPIIYGIHNSEFRNAFNRIFFKHLTLKNGRQYLNRRFSYDLRPHHHNQAAGHTQRLRAKNLQYLDANNNNNSQQSAALVPLVVTAAASNKTMTPANKSVGLASGESNKLQQQQHQDNNKSGQRAQRAALYDGAGGGPITTGANRSNARAHGQGRASSLAMGSSLDLSQQQQCLGLLNCLQERKDGGHTSTGYSASSTTVHRTSEDLSGNKMASVEVTTTEEQHLQQAEPQTVAIS